MVRRGSTVRVRQRALQKPRKAGLLLSDPLARRTACSGYGALYGAFRLRSVSVAAKKRPNRGQSRGSVRPDSSTPTAALITSEVAGSESRRSRLLEVPAAGATRRRGCSVGCWRRVTFGRGSVRRRPRPSKIARCWSPASTVSRSSSVSPRSPSGLTSSMNGGAASGGAFCSPSLRRFPPDSSSRSCHQSSSQP